MHISSLSNKIAGNFRFEACPEFENKFTRTGSSSEGVTNEGGLSLEASKGGVSVKKLRR